LIALKRVLSSLLLVVLLLCGLTDRAGAASTALQKTVSGSLGQTPDKYTFSDPLLVLELQRDREVWGYDIVLDVDVGPNLYAYVRQNPWSKFDPLGLYLTEKLPEWAQPLVPVVAPVVTIADGFIDGGIEAKGAYEGARSAGGGVASSGIRGRPTFFNVWK